VQQLVSVLVTVGGTIAVIIGVFVGANVVRDFAPRRFRLFAAFAGALFGFVIGAIANSGGWFDGGSLWPTGGAVVGAVLGATLWAAHPPSMRGRRRIVERTRPILFLAPALIFLVAALVIPTIRTIVMSLHSRRGDTYVGLQNYRDIFSDKSIFTVESASNILTSRLFIAAVVIVVATLAFMLLRNATTRRGLDFSAPLPVIAIAGSVFLVLLAALGTLDAIIWNNLFWVVFVTSISTVLGLAIAVLADRSRGESAAKSLIFMPMAISFVGASVIWRFVYAFEPAGSDQIGLFNAIWTMFGGDPQPWIQQRPWNNLLLIAIMIWIQTGFAMVILSSAIKGVPTELVEAAKVDGASEGQIFWRITLPQIRSTVLVVVVTVIMTVLKVYDIVKVMTNGQFGTEVIANRMFNVSFINRDYGTGSALAVLIFIAVLPLMILNVRRSRKEGA
jgi:ABC-type sugar transport system permease subunit